MTPMKLSYDLDDVHVSTDTEVGRYLILSLGSCWRHLSPTQARTMGQVLQSFADIADGVGP